MMTPPTGPGASFLRVTAVCWMVSGLTTLGLIFLPYFYAPIDGDPARRLLDPVYMTRVWVALLHPLIVLVGALGVAAVRLGAAPGWAAGGFVFFLLWAGIEAVQQGLTLVTLNWTWRAEFLQAIDPAARDRLGAWIAAFDGVSVGLFFVLLIAFVVADLFFAIAVWGGPADPASGRDRLPAGIGARHHQCVDLVRPRWPARCGDGGAVPAHPTAGADAHRYLDLAAGGTNGPRLVRPAGGDAEAETGSHFVLD